MTKVDANRNIDWGKQALWQSVGARTDNGDDPSARQAMADELGYRHSGLMAAYIGAAK